MDRLSDYNYQLPESLIAQEACYPADHAKLLSCSIDAKGNMRLQDKHFFDLPDMIDSESVIFFNNSKVIRARIPLKNIAVTRNYLPLSDKKRSLILAQGEIFIYKVISRETNEFEALVSDGKHFKPGTTLIINKDIKIESKEFTLDGIKMELIGMPLSKFLDNNAELPLPPYITYNTQKESDYQNVFATQLGSVAAPTAWLHFTPSLLSLLSKKWVQIEYLTLHVWLWTFKPIEKEIISEHNIHSETVYIDFWLFERIENYKNDIKKKKEIISVGTTSTRTLESLPYLWILYKNSKTYKSKYENHIKSDKLKEVKGFRNTISKDITVSQAEKIIDRKEWENFFDTRLYIKPGFLPKVINTMITNFHLPRTSLLIMVSSLMGYENCKKSYQHAINQNYRFYSFGDWMMIRWI